MGVKGLTTYINNNSHHYLTPFELHDCNLVIDGNNLACQLYKWCGPHNSAYGGDYDRYFASVSNVFQVLKTCNVTPYVIMDGGYETRKLKTVNYRFRQKIRAVTRCTPSSQNDVQVFPLFMKYAFKDVLRKFSISFAQCDFEADEEIAAVARRLNCPVLSFDSDFYIYNVPYIASSTCEFTVSQKEGNDGKKFAFMKCKIYHVEGLIKHFGGLDDSLLPLIPVLLGNDYVDARVFRNFFLHVKLPSSKTTSMQQRKIATVIEWLKPETVESALTKILSKFKKERRMYLSRLFERSIRLFSEDFSNTLEYLGLSTSPSKSNVSLPQIDWSDEAMEKLSTTIGDDEFVEESDSDNESDSEKLSEIDELDVEIDAKADTDDTKRILPPRLLGNFRCAPERILPPWLLGNFRRALVDSSVANMFYLSRYYFEPLVEDYSLTPSYEVALPILKVIYGLLVKSDEILQEDEEYGLICFGRTSRGKPHKFVLSPVFKTVSIHNFCNLSSLNSWPVWQKLCVLYDTMTICGKKDTKLLYIFPEEWRLYVMSVVYWGKETKEWPYVSNCHIHALILCMIALGVIDSKVGYFRNSSTFLKKCGSRIRKAQKKGQEKSDTADPQSKKPDNMSQNKSIEGDSPIETALLNVSEDECLFLVELMIDYHQGKGSNYSLTAVHSFAQFQNCLHLAQCLNSVLESPVPDCKIASFYSGKFITSVYADFSKRSNLEVYLDLLMKASPTIRTLYNAIAQVFFSLLPNVPHLVRRGKNKRKKKSAKQQNTECAESRENDTASTNNEGEFSHLGSRFSVLRVE